MQTKLQGRLDMDRCGPLARELSSALKVGENLALDFSGVETADTSALALILDLLRTTRQKQGTLSLRHLPAGLATLASLYGLDGLISQLEDVS